MKRVYLHGIKSQRSLQPWSNYLNQGYRPAYVDKKKKEKKKGTFTWEKRLGEYKTGFELYK